MDGKSQAWRDTADKLLEALARDNQYIVGDMLVIFLESAGYGLDSYEPLGGVFKRAAKKGIVSKIDRPTKQALWFSKIYEQPMQGKIQGMAFVPKLEKGMRIGLKNFGDLDSYYRIGNISADGMHLELCDE